MIKAPNQVHQNGFWYVKQGDENYGIVYVAGDVVWEIGTSVSNPQRFFEFIRPVPGPTDIRGDEDTEELLVKLREELNLPRTAPVLDVFKEAHKVAREALDKSRENP